MLLLWNLRQCFVQVLNVIEMQYRYFQKDGIYASENKLFIVKTELLPCHLRVCVAEANLARFFRLLRIHLRLCFAPQLEVI